MGSSVEFALGQFLSADPLILEMVQTKPQPPRIFPMVVPQGQPRDKPAIVYEVMAESENFTLAHGPHGLPSTTILLECRSPKRMEVRKLAKLVKESRGGNDDNRRLNGFVGSLGQGYVVQMAKVENSSYDYEPPIKDAEVGTHIMALELVLWWNNDDSLLTQ